MSFLQMSNNVTFYKWNTASTIHGFQSPVLGLRWILKPVGYVSSIQHCCILIHVLIIDAIYG